MEASKKVERNERGGQRGENDISRKEPRVDKDGQSRLDVEYSRPHTIKIL